MVSLYRSFAGPHVVPCRCPSYSCADVQGYVLNSTIDGCIQMKSYLSGNPGLRLALNEDLVVRTSVH